MLEKTVVLRSDLSQLETRNFEFPAMKLQTSQNSRSLLLPLFYDF